MFSVGLGIPVFEGARVLRDGKILHVSGNCSLTGNLTCQCSLRAHIETKAGCLCDQKSLRKESRAW